jgi:hypothetical protein
MPLNVGAPIGSEAYTTANTQNAYANAYAGATTSQNKSGGKTTFRYPLKRLDNTSDYLEIKIFDYIPGGGTGGFEFGPPLQSKTTQQRQKANKVSPTHYIILPIPQNISDSISVSWGEDNINPIEAAALGFAGAAQTKGLDAIGQAMKFLKSNLTEVSNNPTLQNAIQNVISGNSLSALGGNVNATGLISRATGQVMNSNLELLFQGVNLRTFPFTFDLAPRSRQEAEEIKGIIKVLKQTMSARNGGAGTGSNTNAGLFINAPSVYQLTYKTGPAKHSFLNTFKPCALTDISVNYTASGTYATYEDGAPVHLQMSLVFKELNPIYSEDYDQPEAMDGVGY